MHSNEDIYVYNKNYNLEWLLTFSHVCNTYVIMIRHILNHH